MKKMGRRALIALLAIVGVLGAAVTAYAAAGSVSANKVGNQYAVDYISQEYFDSDGILVQVIERKWIPESRYDANNPRVPKNSSGQTNPNQNTDRTQSLRNAAINSKNDLQTYGWSYQWSTTATETYTSSEKLVMSIKFEVDASASADRWTCTFDQVTTWNGSYPVVRYYIGSTEYTPDSIKTMFRNYGKSR